MNKMQKINFKTLIENTKYEVIEFQKAKAVRFFPIFLTYSLTIIILLKLAKIIL